MSRGRSLARGVGRVLLGLGIVVLLVVVGLGIITSTGVGIGSVVPWALARMAPAGWDVRVAGADGEWGSRLRAYGLEMRGPSGVTRVDEIALEYRLLPLLRRTIDLRSVHVSRPVHEGVLTAADTTEPPAAEPSDSSALTRLLSDSPIGSWTLDLADLRVEEGRAVLTGREGAYRVDGATLFASLSLTPDGMVMDVDSLSAQLTPPDTASSGGGGAGTLHLAARLDRGLVEVRSLRFESPRSHLRGAGTLLVAPTARSFDDVDFSLEAEPLDLRDLPVSLPPRLAKDPRLTLHVTANGPPDSMRVIAEASGPGSMQARAQAVVRAGAFRAGAHALPALAGTASVTADLSEWGDLPLRGAVAADVALELAALDAASPATLRATVVHRPPESTNDLLGGPLRVEATVSRTVEADDGADSAVARTQAHATIYRAAPSGWTGIGALAVQEEAQRADWQVDLRLDSGSLSADGEASWATDARELVVREISTEDFDLSALSARYAPTSLTSTASARVTGGSLDALGGRIAMSLAPSTWGSVVIDAVEIAADLEPGSATGSLMAATDRATVSSTYRVELRDSVITATLTSLEGEGIAAPVEEKDSVPGSLVALTAATAVSVADSVVDSVTDNGADDCGPGAGAGRADANQDPPNPAPAGDSLRAPWSLRARGTGTWKLGATREATAQLELSSSSVGSVPIPRGTLTGEILGDSVNATANLDIDSLMSAPASVTLNVAGHGTDVHDALGTLQLRAARTSPDAMAGAAFSPPDSLIVDVRADAPGAFTLAGQLLPSEGGRVDMRGTATATEDRIAYEIETTGVLDVPSDLLRGGTIRQLVLESAGARNAGTWEGLDVALLIADATWGAVVADSVRAVARYDASGLTLDTVDVATNVLTLAGGGTLPVSREASSGIDLTAAFDLEPLRNQVETELPTIGSNDVVIHVTGSTDSVNFAMTSTMTALIHRDVRVSGFEGAAHLLLMPPFTDLAGLVETSAHLEFDRISFPDSDVGNITVDLEGDPDSLRLQASALVDESRRGQIEARIDPTPDGRSMDFDRMEFQLDEDQWMLTQPARLAFRDGFELRGFRLEAGTQAIAFDGGVTANGALDVSLDMDSTDLGAVADLIGFPLLDGWLAGQASLTGTTDAPQGTVDLTLGYHEEGGTPTIARLQLEADGTVADTNVELVDPDGGRLLVSGYVPLAEDGEVDLRVDAEAFAIASGIVFVDAELLTELEGRVDASIGVTGPISDLSFDGPVSLDNGLARLPPLGVTWERARVEARGDGRSLLIDSGSVRSGSGTMSFAGTIDADTLVMLDLNATFDDFQAIQTSAYQAAVSGELSVGGSLLRPVVGGRLGVESLDVYIDERVSDGNLEDVALDAADLETLRERFGYVVVEEDLEPARGELLTADLTVELGPDSWIRSRSSPEMAVAFSGEVDVTLRPGELPRVQGTLTTTPERGYIAQFGKRFSPREGTVTLNGLPTEAELDLSASYTVPSHANPDGAEATIVLGVTGTREDLALTLTSEPPMENADIVSYIATGRPAASTFALGDPEAASDSTQADDGGGGGIAEAGAGLAVGQILNQIELAAQTGVGLDVVEIRREGIRGATLAAGKYVSPRLYIGFAQPVLRRERDGLSAGDNGGSEIEIEFAALRGLLLNLEGSASALSLFLRGRIAY